MMHQTAPVGPVCPDHDKIRAARIAGPGPAS